MKISRSQRGFTLIELVVYIVGLLAILGVIIAVLLTINRTEGGMHANLAVADAGTSVLEKFTREARWAEKVDQASSVLNASPGAIRFTGVDSDGNPRTVDFVLTNGGVHYKENNVDEGSLTPGGVNVTNLTFNLYSTTTAATVRIRLSLENGTSTSYRRADFYTTTTLRNS